MELIMQINNQIFWKAIPADKFDENKHGFRISSVEENTNNLENICLLIKKHLHKAKIIFTLSPIPLMATFRPQSCITANSISIVHPRAASTYSKKNFNILSNAILLCFNNPEKVITLEPEY